MKLLLTCLDFKTYFNELHKYVKYQFILSKTNVIKYYSTVARVLDSQQPGFESYATVCLHCFSSLSFMNEYLAIDRGQYLCMNTLRSLIAGCFPQKLRWCFIKQVCHRVKCNVPGLISAKDINHYTPDRYFSHV